MNIIDQLNARGKRAVEQYVLDHCTPQKNGYQRVYFYIWDLTDFWRRVQVRLDGTYIRCSPEEARKKMDTEANKLKHALYMHNVRGNRIRLEMIKIEKEGSLKDKLLLKLYRYSKKTLFENLKTFSKP